MYISHMFSTYMYMYMHGIDLSLLGPNTDRYDLFWIRANCTSAIAILSLDQQMSFLSLDA